jgi:phosphatidylserine/phosphatidylglycerophosphate/cardiolipin synthase-like enzyme
MRTSVSQGPLRVRAVAGTRVILMAFDVDQSAREGLHGFAIKQGIVGSGQEATWLMGTRYFKELVPSPQKGAEYSSRQHPFQTFLWSDYIARPDTEYDITVVALYGDIRSLEERHSVVFQIRTEKENDKGHGIWFNRGAIASRFHATHFQNKNITPAMFNNVDAKGHVLDPLVQWLSRGLEEACVDFINSAHAGEALRLCAYEFTYLPILAALKRALATGVDVKIIYHLTAQNTTAIKKVGLPKEHGNQQVLFSRTRTRIPHNKFIVKLVAGQAQAVWTGSTNFTDTGLFGQTNVGHLVTNSDTAGKYNKYWDDLSIDPPHSAALENAVGLTPNPPNVIPKSSIAEFYSPRIADNMLDWYGQRIDDAVALAAMTIPFNVAPAILRALGQKLNSMRLVILEDPPAPEVKAAELRNWGRLAFSNGAILGQTFIKYQRGVGGAKVAPIPRTKIEEWFIHEELARPLSNGHVFFVHSKLLLIDPLSDDPLVCSGSANFSPGSLINNDENMLLIRGDTRVADIYLTEFDRIFQHFFSRDWINILARKGKDVSTLDPDFDWIAFNFKSGTYRSNRRLMFFPSTGASSATWSQQAANDPDPFVDEAARAAALRKKKNDAAKARRQSVKGSGSAKKTGARKTTRKRGSLKTKLATSKKRAVTKRRTKAGGAKKKVATKRKKRLQETKRTTRGR